MEDALQNMFPGLPCIRDVEIVIILHTKTMVGVESKSANAGQGNMGLNISLVIWVRGLLCNCPLIVSRITTEITSQGIAAGRIRKNNRSIEENA